MSKGMKIIKSVGVYEKSGLAWEMQVRELFDTI
jgi:hypothetical protein